MPRSARTRSGRPPSSAASRATCSPIRRWARWRWPNRRSRSRASRARRNSKPTASASAFRRAPGYDPYGATRFLTSMGRNAELKAATAKIDPHSLDFLSSHPATPERVRNAQLNARQYVAPGPGTRDKDGYLEALDGLIFGEDPSEGFVRGRRFLHPKLGFTFTAPRGLHARQYRAGGVRREGRRRTGVAPRRRARAGRPEAAGISPLRLDREYRRRKASKRSRSTASRPRPRSPRATNGGSGSMPCASAAKSIASSSPPRRRASNSTVPPATRSAASAACRAPKPMPRARCGCAP